METDNQVNSNESASNSQETQAASVENNSQAPAPTEASAPTEWKPDFKFKVMDKEHEIDPLFQPIIKDEDTLKKVKRLHEQAMGIPHLEASRDEFKNKYSQALPRLQEYETVEKKLDKLSYFVQNKDFGSFFNELKIPRDAILHWVKKELDMMEAPQEYRQAQERASELARQKYDYEQELNYYRSQAQMAETQAIHQQIDSTINSTAGDIASQFNERLGDPEAFKNAVINKGIAMQQATGQQLGIDQVVNLVKQDIAKLMGITEAQPAVQNTNAPQAQPKAPVIPVIKAGGTSPVKAPVKSLEDLKKLAANI